MSCAGTQAGLACMAAIPFPPLQDYPREKASALPLHTRLREEFAIEVPVSFWSGLLWFRISAQIYNTLEGYSALAEAIRQLRGAVTG